MKHLTISLLVVFLSFIAISSCDSGKTANLSNDALKSEKTNTDKKNPTDQLSKEDALKRMNKAKFGKNKSDDDVSPEVTDLVAKKKNQGGRIGAGQAEQSSRNSRLKYEKVKDLPPTAEQKRTGDSICECLNSKPLFKPLSNTKTAEALIKKAGPGKDREVKALQDCYNNIMVPAVQKLGAEAGIYSMKSRTYLNNKCLDGTDSFWINIGAYLSQNLEKADVEINLLDLQKNQ